ncbi:MAG TPA: DUF4133 domain-containing protein [Puia sp.]|nr:DUF4133 domain-containing protein [Puia sp.]
MTTFNINRNVGRPIEFRGLKAQYILYAGGLLVADFLLFVILYLCHVNSWICVALSFGSGATGVSLLYRRSRIYGAYGWARRRAGKNTPKTLCCRSCTLFIHLKKMVCHPH